MNAVNRNNAPEGACAKKASLADDKNSELEAAGWSGPSINEAAELQRFANAGRLVASVYVKAEGEIEDVFMGVSAI